MYTYDAAGNRTQMVDGGTTNYTYDANNKMTVAGNIAYTYDSNGNTVTKTVGGTSTTTYSYDWADQLTGITYPDATTAAFAYGPVGERVSKTESGTTLYYWHDGVRVILEGTFSGATWTQNAQYTVEGDSYYDPLISMRRGGATSHYLYDQIGSTRKLINSGETVTDTYQYEAFGNLKSSTGSTTNPYQYVGSLGYHKDPTSELLHLGARYCDPVLGRFLQSDVVPVAGIYAYASNSPLTAVDANGAKPRSIVPRRGLSLLDLMLYCVTQANMEALTFVASADKTAHCYFHCEVVKCMTRGRGLVGGVIGMRLAGELGMLNEYVQFGRAIGDSLAYAYLPGMYARPNWGTALSPGDMEANAHGLLCALQRQSCYDCCCARSRHWGWREHNGWWVSKRLHAVISPPPGGGFWLWWP